MVNIEGDGGWRDRSNAVELARFHEPNGSIARDLYISARLRPSHRLGDIRLCDLTPPPFGVRANQARPFRDESWFDPNIKSLKGSPQMVRNDQIAEAGEVG
jgi:hypothetical protein